jgi:hypothetical protein
VELSAAAMVVSSAEITCSTAVDVTTIGLAM